MRSTPKLALVWLLTSAAPAWSQQSLELSGYTWTGTAPDVVVEEHLGRRALRLRSGAVVLQDVTFESGVIEYDVATTGHRSFVGVAFRLREAPRVAYEHFYMRPHQTGRFDATQYTPDIGGLAAWQLYPEHNAAVDIPANEWVHVRLVVSGERMEAWVGDGQEPVLVVDDLRLARVPGAVALTSNFPEAASLDLYPTAFSNVVVTPEVAPPAPSASSPVSEGVSAPGTVTEWALSASVPGGPGHVTELDPEVLGGLSWDVVPTDALGRLNIAEHRAFADGAQEGRIYARVVIHAEEPRLAPLGFGFSDRGSIFLNGRLLLTADNTYRSRSGRYLGVMTVTNDNVYLPLEAGANELVVAVTEAFGGWGLVARIGAPEGTRVEATPPPRR
jgi:hypothetical protein